MSTMVPMHDGGTMPLPPSPLYVVAHYDGLDLGHIVVVPDLREANRIVRDLGKMPAAHLRVVTRPRLRKGLRYKVFTRSPR